MKFSKKTTMIMSFTLGTLLFATTALADIVNKSGYERLKDTFKTTAEVCSENLNSFTMDMSLAVKDNGKIIESSNEVVKVDRSQGMRESSSHQESIVNGTYNHYSYEDKNTIIRKGMDDQTFYVTEYTEPRSNVIGFNNPFEENGADDAERILDALVGSLKDHVVVKENTDGSKEFSGSLNEMQIPALINAVASFQLKQEFSGRRDQVPYLEKDIFVKEVSGFASVNAEGIMENIRGTGILSGKDKNDQVHEFTFEVLMTLKDINSTVVTKPDLTDQKVVKEVTKEGKNGPGITNPEMFIGKFKNDIIMEKDGKFIKIGERFVQVTHIDNKTIAGKYYEVYKEGYEEYTASGKKEFTIDAKYDQDPYQANFTYTNESGTSGRGSVFLDQHMAKLYLNLELRPINNGPIYDSVFSPAFEE